MIIDNDITYDWLVSTFKNKLALVLDNITSEKYNIIPDCFKTNWYTRQLISPSVWKPYGGSKGKAYLRLYYPALDCDIYSNTEMPYNCVEYIPASVFYSVYDSWVNKIGLYAIRNEMVSSNGLQKFITKVLEFCNQYISIYSSYFSSFQFVCFKNTGYVFPEETWIENPEEKNVIVAIDSETFNFEALITKMMNTVSGHIIQYNYHQANAYDGRAVTVTTDVLECTLPSEFGKIVNCAISAVPACLVNGQYVDGNNIRTSAKCLIFNTTKGNLISLFPDTSDKSVIFPTEEQILNGYFSTEIYTPYPDSAYYTYPSTKTWVPAWIKQDLRVAAWIQCSTNTVNRSIAKTTWGHDNIVKGYDITVKEDGTLIIIYDSFKMTVFSSD